MAAEAPHADPDRDEQAVVAVVDRCAGVRTSAGIPRTASRVVVPLLATDSGPADRDRAAGAAAQQCGGTVPGAVGSRSQVGPVDREHEAGSGRDHDRVRADVRSEAPVRREQLLGRWDRTLHEGCVEAGGEDAALIGETTLLFGFVAAETPDLLRRWPTCRAWPWSSEAHSRRGKKQQ